MYLAAKQKRKDNMNIQQQTQNVAAQGRYGDTMLMHVNPLEVKGLSQVAPITINPQTGQPEAFLFLAPLLGSLLGPSLFGAMGATGALTGLAGSALGSGLAQWAATGDFKKGLLAGVTGYGIGSALQGAAGAAEATKAATAATDAATAAGAIGDLTTREAITAATQQAGAEGTRLATQNLASAAGEQLGYSSPWANIKSIFTPSSPGVPGVAGVAPVAGVSPHVAAASEGMLQAGTPYASPTLGDSFGSLMTGIQQPAALAGIAGGMAPTSIMDSQEQFAAEVARRQQEEEESRMQNFLMNPEPILYSAQGGRTGYQNKGRTETIGMVPQLSGPDGYMGGRKNEEELDQGLLMDADLLAKSISGPIAASTASSMQMNTGGNTGGYSERPNYPYESPGGPGGPDSNDQFSGDFQRFSPARKAYDINPNFMPGFQAETMYFSPSTLNAPASATRGGSAPTLQDTYTGSKGGYGMPGMAIAPRTSIDPYEAFTGTAPQGLIPTEAVPYPQLLPSVDDIPDYSAPVNPDTETPYINPSIPGTPGMSMGLPGLGIDFSLSPGMEGMEGMYDPGMFDGRQRGNMTFNDVVSLGQLPNPIITEDSSPVDFNPGINFNAGPNMGVRNTGYAPQLLTDYTSNQMPVVPQNQIPFSPQGQMPFVPPIDLSGIGGMMSGGGNTRMGFDEGGGTGETLIQESNRYKNYYLKGNTESFKDYSAKENVNRYIKAQKSILNRAKTPEQKQAIRNNIQSHINTPIGDYDSSMSKLSGNELYGKMKKSLLPEEDKSQKDRFDKAFGNKKQTGGRTNFDVGGTTNIMEDPITQETIQFIMGETDNQQVINEFINKYGNEVFLELRNTVLKSLVPDAQTEGLIRGEGQSGMADDIPGMIGSDEKIAVSQDEFIVPADVVSALGDGSSDAGSNALYGMMDRVRQAKTGGTTQPPMINLSQVMPA